MLNVRTPTLVGIGLFVRHMRSDMHVEFSYFALCSVLSREGLRSTGLLGGFL